MERSWIAPTAMAIATVSIVVSVVLWLRVNDLGTRLDETSQVVAGLGVQAALIDEVFGSFGGPLAEQLQPVIEELDSFANSTISIPIDIDEELPIDTEVRFMRTLQVPIVTQIPINKTIDTTVTVGGPLGVDIDLDVTVPIDVVVPIDLQVPFEIDEVVPIRTTVPVQLSFPLDFEVAGTPLVDLAMSLRDGLAQLADSLP